MGFIHQTIGECFERRALETPDEVFIRHEGESFTWKATALFCDSFKQLLLSKGIKKGSRVGIFGVNTPGWIISFLALQQIGAVTVLINSYFKEKELQNCIEIADVEFLLYTGRKLTPEVEEVVGKLVRRNTDSKAVNRIGWVMDIGKTFREWTELLWQDHGSSMTEESTPAKVNDLCCILFTSGTTNACKGVKFDHFSLINNAREVVKQMRWTQEDRMCLTVPLFHCFGVTISLLTSVIGGMSISLLHKYSGIDVCKVIERDRCTVLNGVPSMFLALTRNPRMEEYDLSSLKSGIIAGSPIYEREYHAICEKLRTMKLQPSYGLTEAAPCVTLVDYEDPPEKKALTAGKVIDHVEVRIVDWETQQECKSQEVGEIHIRGYNVTGGYLVRNGGEANALQPDGWFRTGDLAYRDEEGYLYIAGRRKNLIIRGGENISPHEIEKYIKEVDVKLEVSVFGTKTEVLQEEIVACIEGSENPMLEEKIRTYLTENISRFKVPKYFVFVEEFPRNSTGKVNQQKIRKIAEEKLTLGK